MSNYNDVDYWQKLANQNRGHAGVGAPGTEQLPVMNPGTGQPIQMPELSLGGGNTGGGVVTQDPTEGGVQPGILPGVAGTPPAIIPPDPGTSPGGGAAGGTGGFYSPELEGLKHTMLGKDWTAGSPYKDTYESAMGKLMDPVTRQIGLTDPERQGLLNQARSNIGGQTQSMLTDLEHRMGGQGFRGGESGRADTAMAGVAREGQQQFGKVSSDLATKEMMTRFDQGMGLENLNLQRMLGSGQFAQLLESGDLQRLGLGLQAGQFGSGMEQFQRQLQAQQAAQSAAQGSSNERFEWEKDRWGQEFGYGQEMDALKLLMGMYGQSSQEQQNLWSPYQQGIQQAYGRR